METITAAGLEGPRDLSVDRVQLAEPRPDEVRVDLKATGVCHTDLHRYDGSSDPPHPIVLGHEGAGVVDAIGEAVSSLDPGDHVVLPVIPFCRSCEYCERGEPYLCAKLSAVRDGAMLDGTRRLSRDGEAINHLYAQSSFATKCVVAEQTAVSIPESLPFEEAALLGCGATTGLGAVTRTASVRPGESVAVFGCGGVGMNAVQGASLVNADPVVAIDVVPDKLSVATQFGATDTVDASEADPVAAIEEVTSDGVEYALECISNPAVIEQAIEATRPGGTAVLTTTSSADDFRVSPGAFTRGKRIVGNVAGSARPHIDIPRYADLALDGEINLGDLVSRTYPLSNLDRAFEDLESGSIVRGVITYEE